MKRQSGQVLALLLITVLVIFAVWYQANQSGLQTQLLGPYGYGGVSGTQTTPASPSTLQPNNPQSTRQVGGVVEYRYLVPFGNLTVLDGLQMSQFVPSFSTPVRWVPDSNNYVQVPITDELATRTTFLSPDKEGELIFALQVKDANGDYKTVGNYVFLVVSPLAFAADVNKDGKYDFQNDLVHLLRNWDTFGADATQTLALILSRLEP